MNPDNGESDVSLNETLSRVAGIVARRRWWILFGFCAAVFATAGALCVLPNRYTSEATILVVQQQVPERYVVPTSTNDISKALQGIKEQVLSRTRLLAIIDDFGLYPKKKGRLAPESLVDLMRDDVNIALLENNPEKHEINAFRISFTGDNPKIAQFVASRLTTLFIAENLKSREDQAVITTKFLQEQLEAAKVNLSQQETAVRDFKVEFLGELPEQQRGNLEILAGLQGQLQGIVGALSRAQQQRLYLESLLTQHRRVSTRRSGPVSGAASAPRPSGPREEAERDLKRLQAEKAELMSRYSSLHPDVFAKEHVIRAKMAEIERLPPTTVEKSAPEEVADNDIIIGQIDSQLQANKLEIQDLSKTREQLKAEIEKYSARLNTTPVREQQLSGLLRDYDLMKQNYADLLGKNLQSQLATTLEKRQEGQQFRLVDPPNFPTIPSSPKRLKIALWALAGGILLGAALAFLVEMKDSSLRTERDCMQQFAPPFVVGVPFLPTPHENRIRTWKRIAEWGGGLALLACVAVVEAYVIRLS